jgi:hypothetical protein
MPILLWPFPTGVAPPPVVTRTPTGKVFIVDVYNHYAFGEPPNINESCVLVFSVGPSLTPGASITLTFTDPNGVMHIGNPSFAFIGPNLIFENFPFNGFPGYQYIVYTFGENELDVIGLWSVQADIGNFISQTGTFRVVPLGTFP